MNKLERLRKLHNEATEGPWRAGDELVEAAGGLEWEAVAAILKPPYVEYDYVRDAQPAQVDRSTNARLIAEARNALPTLLAVAETAQEFKRANAAMGMADIDDIHTEERAMLSYEALVEALAPLLGESDE